MKAISSTRFTLLNLMSVAVLSLIIQGCGEEGLDLSKVKAHYLQYEVSYEEEVAGDIPTRWLPRTMECWYTDHYAMTNISAFLNQFSLSQVSNLRNGKVTTILNFFGTKVWYESQRGELPAAVHDPGILNIEASDDSMTIGGLLSFRSRVETENKEYDIYFTRDFETRRPNQSTPYREVDEVLSEFRIQVSLLKMKLSCTSYEEIQVPRDQFKVPEGYREVDRAMMENIIGTLFIKE